MQLADGSYLEINGAPAANNKQTVQLADGSYLEISTAPNGTNYLVNDATQQTLQNQVLTTNGANQNGVSVAPGGVVNPAQTGAVVVTTNGNVATGNPAGTNTAVYQVG